MDRKKFLQLQQKWDQKLAKSGFTDIEDRASGLIKDWNYSNVCYDESYEEYYRLASEYLHVAKFKNSKFREVWRLHSEGVTLSKTGELLGFNGPKSGRSLAKYYVDTMLPRFRKWCNRKYGYNLKKVNDK